MSRLPRPNRLGLVSRARYSNICCFVAFPIRNAYRLEFASCPINGFWCGSRTHLMTVECLCCSHGSVASVIGLSLHSLILFCTA